MESLMGELAHSNDPRAEAILAELMKDDLHPLHKARKVNYATWRNRLASSGDALETRSTGSLADFPSNANINDYDISYVNDVMGILGIDEKNQVSYYGRSSGLQPLKQSNLYKDGFLLFPSNTNIQTLASNQKLVLRPELMELPPQELSDHLLELYFNHVHPLFPIIYKPRFFELLKDHEHPPCLLLNSMYCLASNFSDRLEVRKDRENPLTAGDIYFDRAKALLDNDYDRAHATIIQALLLLSIREYGTGKVTRSWIYTGIATRMAQSLGMHRNNEKWHPTSSHGEKEEQKHAAYPSENDDEYEPFPFKMEHATNLISSSDTTNNKTSIQVNRESKKRGESSNSAHIMSRFNCLIRLCEIMGRILQNIYAIRCNQASVSDSAIPILESSLRTWFVTLPPHLQYNPGQHLDNFDVSTLSLHVLYYESLMLLHRPYAVGNNSSHKICTSSAEIISDIIHSMYRKNTLKNTLPIVIYSTFITSVIHTCNATQSDTTISQPAKMNLAKCIRALESLKNNWELPHKYLNLIKGLVELKEISRSLKKRNTYTSNQPNPFDTMDRYGRQARYPSSPSFNFNQAQQPRYLRHNFQEPAQMFNNSFGLRNMATFSQSQTQSNVNTSDPYAAQDVISPNNGVGNHTICSLNSGFWTIPQSANFEEWSSYLHSQQVQQSVTLPSQQTPMSLQPLLLHDNGNNVNMFANNQMISEFE
ncbi:9006_t:CDS:2 [Racocetra fulgida]|uniref:9006_t:CDS:1 n=1 Tax=Racocetra fulgida TaxID=60492 RepID=A0A9N8W1Y6_9GLOM|nr:9006_t:CDS:2 [Racocetra fulgida]